MTSIVDSLLARLPADRVMTDPDAMIAYARDQAEWGAWGSPAAVPSATRSGFDQAPSNQRAV